MSIPANPVRQYSFTGFSTSNPSTQQPGVQIDGEIDRTNAAVAGLIGAVSASLNTDGTLKTSAVQAAYAAGTAPTTGGVNIADAPSAASAALAQAWAEYLPDTLPAAALANTGVTGDHWSARWWANQAALQVQAQSTALAAFKASIDGQIAQGIISIQTAVTVVALNAFAGLNGAQTNFAMVRSDTGLPAVPSGPQEITLVLDGLPQRPGTDFTVAGNTLTLTTAPAADATMWAIWMAPGASAGLGSPAVIDGGSY